MVSTPIILNQVLTPPSIYNNPPFPNKHSASQYQISLNLPRDLICPITHEPFTDPVVCMGDGCTYDRKGILTWIDFQCNRHRNGDEEEGGTSELVRSPVTNAYMEVEIARILVENRIVAGLTNSHRERLGRELCHRCDYISHVINEDTFVPNSIKSLKASDQVDLDSSASETNDNDLLGDRGFRIKCLVDAGCDLRIRKCQNGNTAFMSIVLSAGNTSNKILSFDLLELAQYLLQNDASVTVLNDLNQSCIDVVKYSMNRVVSMHDDACMNIEFLKRFKNLAKDVERRSNIENLSIAEKLKEQKNANAEHREQQRLFSERYTDSSNFTGVSAFGMRNEFDSGIQINTNRCRGLGRIQEHGWGYFPCMSILLFQKNVPPPSLSFAEYEEVEKKYLERILKIMVGIIFLYFFFC